MKPKTFKMTVLAIIGLLVFSGAVFADYAYQEDKLHPEVRQALHEVEEVSITGSGDVSKVWELQKNPESVDIVYIGSGAKRGDFSTSQWNILNDWVSSGHTAWVNTDRNPAFLEAFGFTPLSETDGAVATSTGFHNVLTDVSKVSLGKGYELGEYDVQLLEDDGKVVAALNYQNRGVIIATGSISSDRHDGNRLLTNLYEFGAGYPVPPSVRNGEKLPPSGPSSVKATLKTGEVVTGSLITDYFQFQTPYGQFSFRKNEISFIAVNSRMDSITLKRGDRLLGTLTGQIVRIRQSSGETRTISIQKLSTIVWRQ
ncbi:hypothetical protein KGY79_05115 [Candidatus Bipolaricaulota bacterium]|nr:hypothetical protein [Candidatus Bipolaricaulota bacterium]